MLPPMEFSLSGRLSVTRATGPSSSTRMSLYPAMCTLLIVVDRASALVETLPTTVLYLRPGEYQSLNIVVRLTALRRDGSSPRVSALASGLPLAVRLAHRMLG